MSTLPADHATLDRQLADHLVALERCCQRCRHGDLLLASGPEARYPYFYPRDAAAAVQLFRRVAGSRRGYASAARAYELMAVIARFLADVQDDDGGWGQRYRVDGEDRGLYRQEDNVAHGIAAICNFLLTARRRGREVDDRERLIAAVDRGLRHALERLYQPELNLFHSTTSIHESALEEGYTLWVNFAFLYAFSLAHEVAAAVDGGERIDRRCLDFRRQFLRSVSELFLSGGRYIRRIDRVGHRDLRPDFTLLSPFYFGFLHYRDELAASARFVESQLWDPELGLIMRYLPFHDDFATHVHAGNGPWLQYSAILAQYQYWSGNAARGDELLRLIDGYRGADGAIPEHLSTCDRFEAFLDREWRSGRDFAKEFHRPLLRPRLAFEVILEEANNMARSYAETARACVVRDPARGGGGYIQFAMPLAWSHVEYARALLVRAGDWWKMPAAADDAAR